MNRLLILILLCAMLFMPACENDSTTPTNAEDTAAVISNDPAAPEQVQQTGLAAASSTTQSLANGLSAQLAVTIQNSDGSTINGTNLASWSSSNETVAQVSASGMVTATALGTAQISAAYGVFAVYFEVTVTAATVQNIAINQQDVTVAKGLEQAFTVIATYTDGTSGDVTGSVTFSSSSAAVTFNDEANPATATAVSEEVGVIVTASLGELSAETSMTVGPKAITAIYGANKKISPGQSDQLTLSATFSDGTTEALDPTHATWTSANPSKVTVGENTGYATRVDNTSNDVTMSWVFSLSGYNHIWGSDTTRSGSSTVKVICTSLFKQGLLPAKIYAADATYGQKFVSPATARKYQAWATPLAKKMEESKLLTFLVRPFANAWAYQMAYLMGEYPRPNWLGAFLVKYGVPASNFIGGFIQN